MYPPTRYLHWARRFYGQVEFDLASSGIPAAPVDALRDAPPAPADPAVAWSALCRAIADYNDVPTAEVLPALGTTHALWLAYAALLAPGDEILIEEPAYEPLVRIAEGSGARVRRFGRERDARFALDPAQVERAMTAATRAVVVTNLHNPSGVRTSDDALRAVARSAAARGATLVVDEVYAPFDRLIDDRGVFRGSARKLGPNVVAVSSLTKCYGLGSERIGWVLGPQDLIARAGDALLASVGHLPRSYAEIGLAALANLPALAARARGVLGGQRDAVGRWVAEHGLAWSAPDAGLFGLVIVPGRRDLTAEIEAAVAQHRVLVAPGSFFGVPDAFRLAWSSPLEQLEEGLRRLARALGV
jgi:aspartate/methionine/tyrosine aminotransferase